MVHGSVAPRGSTESCSNTVWASGNTTPAQRLAALSPDATSRSHDASSAHSDSTDRTIATMVARTTRPATQYKHCDSFADASRYPGLRYSVARLSTMFGEKPGLV